MASIPGWKDLVVCGKTAADMCTFEDLITLAQNFITDLVLIATMAVAIVFMWAGLILITAGFRGDSGALSKAKGIFWNVVKGYVIMLVAWVLVSFILSALGAPSLLK